MKGFGAASRANGALNTRHRSKIGCLDGTGPIWDVEPKLQSWDHVVHTLSISKPIQYNRLRADAVQRKCVDRWYNARYSASGRQQLFGRTAAEPVTGGDLVSTGTAKQRGACQGAEPCESSAIANLTANDETYALAA